MKSCLYCKFAYTHDVGYSNLKDNCKWIIPMCLDKEINERIIKVIEND